MVHGVGGEARSRIGVAAATLHRTRRYVRRCLHSQCDLAIVTGRAIGVACRVDVGAARPTGETGRRAGVTGHTILAVRRHMIGEGSGAHCAFRTFTRVGTVVAGVTAGRAHR